MKFMLPLFNQYPPIILILVIVLTAAMACQNGDTSPAEQPRKEYALAIHGGAGAPGKDMPNDRREKYKEGLREALEAGEQVLKEGGSALDAVEASIRVMEDNPMFNAGKGAVFTHEERNELDAAIMDGTNLNAGALTGTRTVKNPISLARKIMTDSKHVFFSGDGAEKFADQFDSIERVDPEYFQTERRLEALKRVKEKSGSLIEPDSDLYRFKFGTVGCVALDKEGRLAAGTSTGGMTNKMFGRVGDVPIVGAGTYADSVAAVSATGWGEKIMLNVASHTVAAHMKYTKSSVDEATNFVIHKKMSPNTAGLISVDAAGNISMPFNTVGMFRAATDSEGLEIVKIWE